MKKVKVSIVIPTYNREELIKETIESAINQEFEDFEIVVVDNCSTDRTYEILKEYQKNYNNIRVYQNEKNIGPVRNWKRAIELAEGEYIKILWSDDQIDSRFLKETVPILENNQDIGFVYTKVMIYWEKRKEIFYSRRKEKKIKVEEFIKGSIGYSDESVPVSPGCALFRKKDLEKNLIIDIPGAENPYGAGNDLLLFLLCCNDYEYFYYLDEVYSFFRAHKNSFSVANNLNKYYIKSIMFFLEQKDTIFLEKIKNKYFTYIKFKYIFDLELNKGRKNKLDMTLIIYFMKRKLKKYIKILRLNLL